MALTLANLGLKSRNESIFKELAESCGGVFGNLQQAVDELGIPRLKSTRPVPSYTGKLTLGDPEKYETALVIDVERYPRTMVRRPLTASQYVHRSDQANDSVQLPKAGLPASDVGYADSDLTNVKNIRTYQVSDERAPGGKRDVGRDDMAKGYEYGRTAVHITESDENVTKLETEAGLDIIGFVPWSKVDPTYPALFKGSNS